MKKLFIPFIFVIITILIFRNWFSFHELASGDWIFRSALYLSNIPGLYTWSIVQNGMGQNATTTLWIDSYLFITTKIGGFLGWIWYERLFWFFPFLLFGTTSMMLLFKNVFKKSIFAVCASFLYIANTYTLLLVGGGQMGLALAYSWCPFVLLSFKKYLESLDLLNALFFAFSFAFLILMDIRIAYMLILVLVCFIFLYVQHIYSNFSLKTLLQWLFIIASILSLHAFWLLPAFFSRSATATQFGAIYTNAGSVTFFSFAKIENTVGLLHPNWPENIFGLTHFIQPEFLLLPILAFSSLLFIGKNNKKNAWILLFTFVGLVGIFLAKGATDPFGNLYLWLFSHIPGFILFRDPTKWYLLIALSYSLLIPYTLYELYNWIQKKDKFLIKSKIFNVQNLFMLVIICYFLFLIRPALFGKLSGTFTAHTVPSEYIQLETYFKNQQRFSRVLLVPTIERYIMSTTLHPAVDGYIFFNATSPDSVIRAFSKSTTQSILADSSIGYIVIPYDSQQEIFLKDRKYSQSVYNRFFLSVKKIPWLREIHSFGNIHIFVLSQAQDRFWLQGQGKVTYHEINPTQYTILLSQVSKGENLIFSDNFDKNWVATTAVNKIPSTAFEKTMNSFRLPKNGSYTLVIAYQPEKWLIVGTWISSITLFTLIAALAWEIRRKMIQ